MDVDVGEAALGVVEERVSILALFLGTELLAALPNAVVDLDVVAHGAVDLVGEVTRHADADDAHLHAVDILDAMLGELYFVKIGLEGILKDLERFLALDLDEVLLHAHILAVHIEIRVLAQPLDGRVEPVGAVAVLGNADDNAIGEDLAIIVTDDGMAEPSELEVGEVVYTDRLQEVECLRAINIVDGRGHEHGADPCGSAVDGRLIANAIILEGDGDSRDRLHEEICICDCGIDELLVRHLNHPFMFISL